MNNRNILSLSWPLMRECFRIYWYIPALSFLMYFFSGIFPILSNLKRMPEVEYYVTESMGNMKPSYMLLLMIVPAISAALMMGFLHNGPKAFLLHAMPLSKDRLFNSYYISGLIFCLIPVVITTILYCMMVPGSDAVQFSGVLKWLLGSAAVIIFFYGISVLAGSLTGTVYMNLIVTGIMMFIVPLVMYIVRIYCQLFIAGFYRLPGSLAELSVKTNPVFTLIYYKQPLSSGLYIAYFFAGILLAALAKEIYRTRKLELIGNAMLSPVFEKICTYLTVFVGMCAFGLLAWGFTHQRIYIVIGMVLGALFTLMIIKIIINRSIKIFNKALIRSLAIYMCIAAIFVAVTIFDVLGIENRVPAEEKIESVEMLNIVEGYDYPGRAYGDAGKEYVRSQPELTSQEAISLVRKLHQYIVDNSDVIADQDNDSLNLKKPLTDVWSNENYVDNENINIRYNLKNGNKLERIYNITVDDEIAEILQEIFTCSEYKEKNKITSYIDTSKISYLTISPLSMEYYDEDTDEGDLNTIIINDRNTIMGILHAWEKDVDKSGYTQENRYITPYTQLAMIDIYFTKNDRYGDGQSTGKESRYASLPGRIDNPYVAFMLTDMDSNLIKYLRERGYTAPQS